MSLFNGKGIFYYSDAEKYLGEWALGKRQGEGKWVQRNGNVYTGHFQDDKAFGFGQMEYKNGHKYMGDWSDNLPNGRGSYYLQEGARYEGHFVMGMYDGAGSFFYSDGSVYKGTWKSGMREGFGELKDKEGDSQIGIWKLDQFDRMVDTSQKEISQKEYLKENTTDKEIVENPTNQMAAENLDDLPKKETMVLPDCTKNYCESGQGIFYYSDGSRYIGDFSAGEAKGKGICHYMNGDRYEGGWENHAPNGEGIMYFQSGLVYGAIWQNGKALKQIHAPTELKKDTFTRVAFDKEVKIWAVLIGISHYEHMPSLKYSDDDAYRMFAYLKSPEGGALKDNQISILIDEDATREKILKHMREIFSKADENDVIMLYYSGHGLEGTFLPIDYNGFKNAIHHDEIKAIYNSSNAKHKVCYVDACHSGSLLATKNPFASSLLYFYEELNQSSGGSAFLMSSKGKEFSLEDGGLRQGIFSHFLIKGLKGAADGDSNKIVTIRELFEYVSVQVKAYTNGVQTPLLAGDYDEQMPVGFITD